MYDDDDDDDRPLCIILPQMIGYIKYCDNGGKMCLLKLKIKVYILNRFHSQPICDDKYIKTKVKTLIHCSQAMKFQKKETITFVLQQFVSTLY